MNKEQQEELKYLRKRLNVLEVVVGGSGSLPQTIAWTCNDIPYEMEMNPQDFCAEVVFAYIQNDLEEFYSESFMEGVYSIPCEFLVTPTHSSYGYQFTPFFIDVSIDTIDIALNLD